MLLAAAVGHGLVLAVALHVVRAAVRTAHPVRPAGLGEVPLGGLVVGNISNRSVSDMPLRYAFPGPLAIELPFPFCGRIVTKLTASRLFVTFVHNSLCFDPYVGDDPDCRDYLSPLTACWFRQQDILNFTPTQRYTTGAELIGRWSKLLGMQPEAFIRAKIEESRLQDIHPISGVTQERMSGDERYPPMSSGLFALSEIEAIEKEDFDSADAGELEIGSPEWRSRNAQNAANVRHDQPGGTRDRQQQIRAIWKTGDYKTRMQCAEQKHEKLGMSYHTALKALRNIDKPKGST